MLAPAQSCPLGLGSYVVFVVCKAEAEDMEPPAAVTFDLVSLKLRGKWDFSETM